MEAFLDLCNGLLLRWGYSVLFAGVLLENAGLPIPGETALLLAGYLSSAAGGHRLDIWLVIVVAVLGALLGDNLGYWLGRRLARPRLQKGKRFLFLTPAALRMAEGYFHHYGSWTIFLARFITGLRVVGALAAGTAGMPWMRFLLANASGAVTWAVTISLLSYHLGEHLQLLERWLSRGGLIALGCVLLLIVLALTHRGLRQLLRVPPLDPGAAGKDHAAH